MSSVCPTESIRMVFTYIHRDITSSGVSGYSDMRFYRDPDCLCLRWSQDCQSYYGLPGYSDMGFYRDLDCLCLGWSWDCHVTATTVLVLGYAAYGCRDGPGWTVGVTMLLCHAKDCLSYSG